MRHEHRIARAASLALRLLEPLAVALQIAETKWVGDGLRQLDGREFGFVKEQCETLLRRHAQMGVAIATDEEIGLKIAAEKHLAAIRAFLPKILRHFRLRSNDGADLRQDEIRQPVHRAVSFCRAWRTPSAKARTSASTAPTRVGSAFPAESREAAMRSTSAEPTTAASATRATSCACAGVRMPKPTATGKVVCRFSLATAAVTLCAAADFVPVMPATET